MSDKPDLDELAERYLDLWQDQMSALAGDPAFAEAMNRLMAAAGTAGSGMTAAWAAWPAMMAGLMPAGTGERAVDGKGEQSGDLKTENDSTRSARTAAAATASGHSGPDLDEFARRLADLEERVAELESGARRRKQARSRVREGRA